MHRFTGTRVSRWDAALVDALALYHGVPFAWGAADCLTLAGDAAVAMTGVDPLGIERGGYGSAGEAAAVIRRLGFASLLGVLAAAFPRQAPAMARRGDWGLVETLIGGKRAPAVVVVVGDQVIGKAAGEGLEFLPRSRMIRAYRVG